MQKEYFESSYPKFYEEEYKNLPVFNATEGVGTEWEYEGKPYIAKFAYGKKQRKVVLNIHSWRGYCADAVHYYGSLEIDDLEFIEVGNNQHRVSSTGQPEITQGAKINIRRPLTQKEIDENPKKYARTDHAGMYVLGFLTKKELIEAAEKIFREKFAGDWHFTIEKR